MMIPVEAFLVRDLPLQSKAREHHSRPQAARERILWRSDETFHRIETFQGRVLVAARKKISGARE
ncbi:hypothetical protein Tco_0476883, partial [Tanacetum coccineum]